MRIYIDEAGGFVVPPPNRPHSYSLVLTLTIPSKVEAKLFSEFLRLRDSWSNPQIEVKGSKLDEPLAAQVIELVSRFDVLVNFLAIDMATHTENVVDDFKLRQADEITAHLTPAHNPNLVTQLEKQAGAMRAMPNQLFLQTFLTINLVLEVIEEATLYYVQRQPTELGEIAWFIDRKNHTITQMEKMWTMLILPIAEGHFVKNPLKTLIGADYSQFHAHYGFTTESVDEEMARHLKWMEEFHGVRHEKDKFGLDAQLLLSDRREFLDSRESLGLQLADMLATVLRRALNNHLQFPGWRNLGKLMVRKRQPATSFLQLGSTDGPRLALEGHAKKVCLALDALSKSMLTTQAQ